MPNISGRLLNSYTPTLPFLLLSPGNNQWSLLAAELSTCICYTMNNGEYSHIKRQQGLRIYGDQRIIRPCCNKMEK